MVAVNYLWNPLNDNIVREFDDGGVAVAEYTTEPDDFGSLVSQRGGGTNSFFHYDGTGSTVALTSDAGTVTDTEAFTAFGEAHDRSGTTALSYRFVGQNMYQLDSELDEYSVRRRRYTVTGRWTSVDPLESPRRTSRYVYALNAPLTLRDPSGLRTIRDILECACAIDEIYDLIPFPPQAKVAERIYGFIDCACNIYKGLKLPMPRRGFQFVCALAECVGEFGVYGGPAPIDEVGLMILEIGFQGFPQSLIERLRSCCNGCKGSIILSCILGWQAIPIAGCLVCIMLPRIRINGKPLC